MTQLVDVEPRGQGVWLVQLNRPEVRNALSPELMEELASELEHLDADPEAHCIVIAGSDEAFAAGAVQPSPSGGGSRR